MKKTTIKVIFFIFYLPTIYSQSDFSISVRDYLWQNPTRNNVDLVVLLSISNIGSEAEADEDINHIYLTCSQSSYKFGKDITFVKFNNSINEVIKPGEEKLGYIIFNVPRDADNLKLKFPENLGGAEKEICMSYVDWGYYNKDDQVYISNAHDCLNNGNYTCSLINYLKAYSINPYLHLSNEIDSTFNMFAQSEESSTYRELFSNNLTQQKTTENELNKPDKIPVKLKGKLHFCTQYKDGQEIGRAEQFGISTNGGYLTIGFNMNREIGIDKIILKVVKIGLIFDKTISENEYNVKPEWKDFYISNIFFSTTGTYSVSAYHTNGRRLAKNKVKIVL